MNDPKLIEASENAVRVLIRRPHAYKFRRDHPKAAIPCLAIMNADGRLLGGTAVPAKNAVATIVGLLGKKPARKGTVR